MKRMAGIVLAALVVVGACSSGGGSKALSKDEFLKQGNAICQKGNDAINAAQQSQFSDQTQQPDVATLQKFFKETVAPNVKKQLDDLAALKPPSDLQSAVDKLVKDARAKLAELQSKIDSDPQSLFNSSEDPFADVNKEANDLGLTTCGQSGGSSSTSS